MLVVVSVLSKVTGLNRPFVRKVTVDNSGFFWATITYAELSRGASEGISSTY